MLKFKILLYKLYKSEMLLLAGFILFVPLGGLITAIFSYVFLVTHILFGMYFKRKELSPYQYGIRIGLIIAMTAHLITKIAG